MYPLQCTPLIQTDRETDTLIRLSEVSTARVIDKRLKQTQTRPAVPTAGDDADTRQLKGSVQEPVKCFISSFGKTRLKFITLYAIFFSGPIVPRDAIFIPLHSVQVDDCKYLIFITLSYVFI